MNTIDHTTSSQFTSFIPTHLLIHRKMDGEIGNWLPINPYKANWLADYWTESVHTIIKIAENIIIVIFNEEWQDEHGICSYDSAVYKGTLK